MSLMRTLKKLKESRSLYEIALDIGISQSTLYNYYTNYKPIRANNKEKIENYLKKVDKFF